MSSLIPVSPELDRFWRKWELTRKKNMVEPKVPKGRKSLAICNDSAEGSGESTAHTVVLIRQRRFLSKRLDVGA